MKLHTFICLITFTLSACNPAPAVAGGKSFSGGAPITPSTTAGTFNPVAPVRIRIMSGASPGQAFPGFTGRKQFTENGMKTIVNYENGKVMSVVQVL